ncbi:MAG: 2-amino-4-hydroxy-6-hydroxymethyldihydropteridine diphosphokinase [Robiginitomaculum sp.]|nr:MAG: 2-amino-4-hydroxy-6-hydroxymethyldihydropteridine diphosphokinase [Robiginitomaculum sp.]
MNQKIQFRKAYISFGANLPFGNSSPAQTILQAMQLLDHHELQFVKSSSLWSSPAWPDPADPEYVNAMALFMCCLTPLKLMNRLGRMERQFGRVASRRNAPRTLDIDLISYGQLRAATKRVQIPHPRAQERAFVLLPLREIAPLWRCPKTGQPIDQLIDNLPLSDLQATKLCKSL